MIFVIIAREVGDFGFGEAFAIKDKRANYRSNYCQGGYYDNSESDFLGERFLARRQKPSLRSVYFGAIFIFSISHKYILP